MSDFTLGELQRMLANTIRVGKVVELDEANARVKVSVSGLTTAWLPWLVSRAGATRTWSAPRPGEQVVVLSPYGDTAQGVVLPSIYQDDYPAPAGSKDKETTVYPDGSTVEYDSASNTLTVTVSGAGNVVVNCKQATVNAETSVTLDTPNTFCTGNLAVAKSLTMGEEGGSATLKGAVSIIGPSVTHNGKSIGDAHQHGGVQTGGSNTGAPV